jgi:signal transduction histidine kinase/DNA-binding response OmpR family regulator
MFKALVLFYILTLSFLTVAEIPFQREIDSLKNELNRNKSDKTKVDLYNKQSVSFRHQGKFDLALEYGLKAEKLALRTGNNQGLVESYEQISETYREQQKYDLAIRYLEKEQKLCVQLNEGINLGNVYDHLGHIYLAKGDTTQALNNHHKSLKTRIKSNDWYGQGNSCNSLAFIYSAKSDFKQAFNYFKKELAVFQKMGTEKLREAQAAGNTALMSYWLSDKKTAITYFLKSLHAYQDLKHTEGILWVSNFLGTLYSSAGEYDKALYYINQTLSIAKQNKKPHLIADAYRHLAGVYINQKDYAKAIPLLLENIERYKIVSPEGSGLMESYNQLGLIYFNQNQYDQAITEYQNSLVLAKKINDKNYFFSSLKEIANIYIIQKKYDLAKPFLEQAIVFYSSIDEVEGLASCYQSLSELNEATGNYKEALENTKQFIYYDSISFQRENDFNNELFRLNTENKFLKDKLEKDKKATLLKESLSTSKRQRNLAFVGLIILLFFALMVYQLLRLRIKKDRVNQKLIEFQQNENKLIKETEQFKSQFLINISHELRTPLTLINGHLEVLKEEAQFKENKHLEEIQRNGTRLLKLINDILDLSKAESGKYKLLYKKGDVINETKAITQSFHSYAEIHAITFSTTCEIANKEDFTHSFIYSSEALNIILTNLLSNAFKYTPDGGEITVKLSQESNQLLYVQVIDNGVGIPSESIQKIFNRFYQVDGIHQRAYDSSGIGLSLVKELTLLHGGDINVETNENGGCTFTFWLKTGNESDLSESIMPVVEDYEEKMTEDYFVEDQNTDLPLVLVVEDQPDLSAFIVSNLSKSYHCMVAKNGVEGLELAKQNVPDLIVSDIMMPEMDGNELCKRLKDDELTSHIPIILLTAKADQDDVIEGLTSGANDYLKKPFSVAELKLRIHNQLESIRKIQQRFQASKEHTTTEISSILCNTKDVDFLEKVSTFIENNIDNAQLGVDLLADKMALSSSQLARKLKSITGMSPAFLIKNQRMNKALELLKQGENISEVAWSVGFDSPAYFGKVFKTHFGFTPSEAQEQK